ncbi:MAG: dihydrolipoyl dehydrogenase [Candidatus Omnitrophota bacterium]
MFDLAIIGAGPGGYAAAKHAAKLGAKVCLIHKDRLGGVCVNEGCIPTKFVITAARFFSSISRSAQFGINASSCSMNSAKMLESKDAIIEKLRHEMESALKNLKVEIVNGEAKIDDPNTIDVRGQKIKAKYIIIATGSSSRQTQQLKFNHVNVISSTDALNFKKTPSSITIVGAGYIGCEFACIYSQLGCDVTLIDIEPQILPGQDTEIARRLTQLFKKRGIKILVNTAIKNLEAGKDKVTASLENGETIESQILLLTIGRKPNTDGLGLESCGVKLNKGAIIVDDKLKTSVDNIYAVGDAIGGYCLEYTASHEGFTAAENIFGKANPIDYGIVPYCIFTTPEVAIAGLSENEAKEKGFDVAIGNYPFMASSKAKIIDEAEGMIKLVCDNKSGRILGVQMLGPYVTELLAEVVVAMTKGMTIKELSGVLHAHPTLSEAVRDAARRVK